jgi:hypothetical protein
MPRTMPGMTREERLHFAEPGGLVLILQPD